MAAAETVGRRVKKGFAGRNTVSHNVEETAHTDTKQEYYRPQN